MKKVVLFCLSLLISFHIFASGAPKNMTLIKHAQLEKLLRHKMLFLADISSFNTGDIFTRHNVMIMAFFSNGVQKGMLTNPPDDEPKMDVGKWWLKGDQLCAHWTKWEKGQSFCTYWYSSQNHYLMFDAKGKLHGILLKQNVI